MLSTSEVGGSTCVKPDCDSLANVVQCYGRVGSMVSLNIYF